MDLNGMTNKELLIYLATKQEEYEKRIIERNSQNDRKFEDLNDEDEKLHHRINDVHSRVNGIKFWSVGSAGLGSIIGSFLGWFTGGKS